MDPRGAGLSDMPEGSYTAVQGRRWPAAHQRRRCQNRTKLLILENVEQRKATLLYEGQVQGGDGQAYAFYIGPTSRQIAMDFQDPISRKTRRGRQMHSQCQQTTVVLLMLSMPSVKPVLARLPSPKLKLLKLVTTYTP